MAVVQLYLTSEVAFANPTRGRDSQEFWVHISVHDRGRYCPPCAPGSSAPVDPTPMSDVRGVVSVPGCDREWTPGPSAVFNQQRKQERNSLDSCQWGRRCQFLPLNWVQAEAQGSEQVAAGPVLASDRCCHSLTEKYWIKYHVIKVPRILQQPSSPLFRVNSR